MNDTTGALAFIPSEQDLTSLYALGFSPQDVFEMKAEIAADILARRETKVRHDARLESEAEEAEAKEAMAASAVAAASSSPPLPLSPSSPSQSPSPTSTSSAPTELTPKDDGERAAIRYWDGGGSPIDPIVNRYQHSRGLVPFDNPPPKNVRFARSLKHGPSQEFRPALLIRLVHEKTGAELCGIQRIYLEIGGKGKAKFIDPSHPPAMLLGDCANGVMRIGDPDPNKPVVVAAGYEKGAAVHLATGLPVFVAFTDARLKTFAPPDDYKHLVVAGENDQANKKARVVFGRRMQKAGVRVDVAMPPRGTADAPVKDFDDLINGKGPFSRDDGLRLIKEIFEKALAGETEKADNVQNFSMTKRGLYRSAGDDGWEYVSQCFETLGRARSAAIDGRMSSWGWLIKFDNPDKASVEEVVPASALQEDPAKIAATLADLGFTIDATPSARRSFVQYLNRIEVKARITLAARTGWVAVGGKRAFIIPGAVIGGDPNERVLFSKEINAPYGQCGTVAEWKENLGRPAADHLLLRFSVGVSLGGPLVAIVGGESGVFHIYGPSSAGKTTASRVAASAWGSGADGAYVRTWRSTANALESTLAASSDCLLVLDEVGQADPREIGLMIYMITNSRGKERLTKAISLRSAFTWRTLVLSTGEVTIGARLSEETPRGGRRGARAGHLVRAIDIHANRASGVFDNAHPDFDGEAFSNQMKDASSHFYGTLGPEFVRQLLDRRITAEAINEKIDAFTVKALEGVNDASGQVKRVAQRLALVVAAGELAAEFDLVPWTEGVPTADGATLFKSWLLARGGPGQIEDRQMLAQVQRFFEAHGESRFDNLDDPPTNAFTGQEMKEKPSSQRAGYREGEGADRRWYVFPQIWRDEICAGLDAREVARLLIRLGIIEKGDGKNLMKQVQIRPGARSRFYVVTPKIFEGWSEADARDGVDEDDE